MLYFGGCTIMLIFRNSGVSRFRKIAMLILFLCWMGFILPLAFLQPSAASLASSDFFLYDTGSDGPRASVNPFNFKAWLFQIDPEFGKPSTDTFKYKTDLPVSPPADTCTEYSRDYESFLELDVHFPKNSTGPYPVLFHVHGGAWEFGDKSVDELSFQHFTSRGYAIVSAQYSLVCHGATVEDMQTDLSDAYRYIKGNANEWNIDMDRVTAIGASAGGHLALLLAYTLKKDDGATNAFRSVFNVYGPSDFVKWDEEGFTSGGTAGAEFKCDKEDSLLKKLAGGCSESELQAISPAHFVSATSPPTITIHGTMDSLVPYQQSEALHAKLDEAGVDNFLISCPGWDHMLDIGYFGPQQLERYALQRLLAADALSPESANGKEEAWGWGIYVAVGMSLLFGAIAAVFMHFLDKWAVVPAEDKMEKMELTKTKTDEEDNSKL